MRKPMHRSIWIVVALASAVAGAALAHEGATGVVKRRMDEMTAMNNHLKVILRALRAKKNLDRIPAEAAAIHAIAGNVGALFPAGSGGHPSAAKDRVWQQWPDFEAKAMALVTASDELAKTDAGDAKVLRVRAGNLADACDNCHKDYRMTDHH
jgi:cytochrome c556